MKSYRGDRTLDGIVVTVDGRSLDPVFGVRRFSPLGFEWGYEGAAPSQLALALLVDHFGTPAPALEAYEGFMRRIVANLANEWELTGDDIAAALTTLRSSTQSQWAREMFGPR
jgi:hypothetical protein